MLATALLAFVIAMCVNAAKAPANSQEKNETQKQEQSQ